MLTLNLRLWSLSPGAMGVRRAIQRATAMLALVLGILAPCAGQQTSPVRVTVVDDQGAAVPNAEVSILELPDLTGIPSPNGISSFKWVPPGTYRISVNSPGFKDKTIAGVAVVEGKTTELTVKLEPSPPKASDYRVHQEPPNPRLYSKLLTEIGQPLICPESVSDRTEWYRFVWVPTFYPPVFLRVDIGPDGRASLLSYIWSGQGGYQWGKPERKLRKLTSEEQADLFATLADIGFWSLPGQVENLPNVVIMDGTESLIEGVKDGACHVVIRESSPLTGLFARQFLAKVAKIKPYYEPQR